VVLGNAIDIVKDITVFLELNVIVVLSTDHWHVCFVINKCSMCNWIILPQAPNLPSLSPLLSWLIRRFPVDLSRLYLWLSSHIKHLFVFLIIHVLNTFRKIRTINRRELLDFILLTIITHVEFVCVFDQSWILGLAWLL